MNLGIHIISDFEAVDPVTVWNLLRDSHPDVLSGRRTCLCGETACTLDDVAAVIRRDGKRYFIVSLETDEQTELSYGHVWASSHAILHISHVVADVPDAEEWVAPLAALPEFREAWLFDVDYPRTLISPRPVAGRLTSSRRSQSSSSRRIPA